MRNTSHGWGWPLANLVALVATVAVNGLANALPLNGISTGDVINRDPVYFQPANWVFGIWGLIYLALAAFVAYSLLPAGRSNPRVARISPFFVLSCVANCVWLFLWHWQQFPVSVAVMLVLLASLIACHTIARADTSPTLAARLCVQVPFSIYLGWICVATIANVTIALDRAGWDGWGLRPELWAVIMLVVAAALVALVGIGRADPIFAAVFVWSFIGIAARQRDTAAIVATATIAALIAAAIALAAIVRALQRPHRPLGRRLPI